MAFKESLISTPPFSPYASPMSPPLPLVRYPGSVKLAGGHYSHISHFDHQDDRLYPAMVPTSLARAAFAIIRSIPPGLVMTVGHLSTLLECDDEYRIYAWLMRLPTTAQPGFPFTLENVPWHRIIDTGGYLLCPPLAIQAQSSSLELSQVVQVTALHREGVEVERATRSRFCVCLETNAWEPEAIAGEDVPLETEADLEIEPVDVEPGVRIEPEIYVTRRPWKMDIRDGYPDVAMFHYD